jgi:ubiquinone/menaquinone biosynthesis C-methylase UbiE
VIIKVTAVSWRKRVALNSDLSTKIESFYDEHPYPALGRRGMYAYIRMKRQLLQSLGIQLSNLREQSFLEAGCGTGESTLAFAHLQPKRSVGVDLSEVALAQAKRLRDELGMSQVEFFQADIQSLGDLGGPFDIVMCEVLHQTANPVETLRGLMRQTKPGGFIILSVANTWGNLGDVFRYHLVATLAGRNPERRIELARRLFFNRFLLKTRCRGIPKAEFLNLNAVIADIYGHPFRVTYTAGDVLMWLRASGLTYHTSVPSLGTDGGTAWSRLVTQLSMWRSNTYHLAVAAMRPDGPKDTNLEIGEVR